LARLRSRPYKTDYRSESYRKAAKADSGDSKKDGGSKKGGEAKNGSSGGKSEKGSSTKTGSAD